MYSPISLFEKRKYIQFLMKMIENTIKIVFQYIENTIENTISFGLIQSTLQEAAVGEGICTKSLTQIS